MKKDYLLAAACFLAIPFVIVGGGCVAVFINPEWAIHSAHYSRNFHLLGALKVALIWSAFGLGGVFWLLTCYFLVKAKGRSYAWLVFAFLGPFGLPVLMALRDGAPAAGDAWQGFVQRRGLAARIGLEVAFFLAAWRLGYQAMVLLRYLLILRESLATGATAGQIAAQQNASGGMYAFSEGCEVMGFVVLIYLLWPLAFNLLARLRGAPAAEVPKVP